MKHLDNLFDNHDLTYASIEDFCRDDLTFDFDLTGLTINNLNISWGTIDDFDLDGKPEVSEVYDNSALSNPAVLDLDDLERALAEAADNAMEPEAVYHMVNTVVNQALHGTIVVLADELQPKFLNTRELALAIAEEISTCLSGDLTSIEQPANLEQAPDLTEQAAEVTQ